MPDTSPRTVLRQAIAQVLSQITTANGYNTDAGQYVTTEPEQVNADAGCVLAAIIGKQVRPTEPAMRNAGRLTDVVVIAKVPAALGQAQARLDAIVQDIEAAMDRGAIPSYPNGWQWPRYVSCEPIKTEPGMGWTGALLTYQTHIPIR